MDNFVDFSGCTIVPRPFGGTDRKFRVAFDNKFYMLKFTDEHTKRSDISTSHENSPISEYISSHICNSIGLNTHHTILGCYGTDENNKEVCVACEDFRQPFQENMEFQDYLLMIYGPKEYKKIPLLEQVYSCYNSSVFPDYLSEKGIERFWDTFVVDALVGNFDRHVGNWGFLSNIVPDDGLHIKYEIAPIYDFGSTLFPILSDEGINKILDNDYELIKRAYLFPSASLYLTKEKEGKVGYYDMLASGINKDCSAALLRIFPKINLNIIFDIVDNTPEISDVRMDFYKNILSVRYELILSKAYNLIKNGLVDEKALFRVQNHISFSDSLLKDMVNNEHIDISSYRIPPIGSGGRV